MENKLFSKKDIVSLSKIFNKLNIARNKGPIGQIKKKLTTRFGTILKKENGNGSASIIFTNKKIVKKVNKNTTVINLNDSSLENHNRARLIEIFIKNKEIRLLFKIDQHLSPRQKNLLKKYINQLHPEALTLAPICKGRGLDVGCGYRKTHPEAIGVDMIKKGGKGLHGNVKGQISEADIKARGDNLSMFNDESVDYIVSRHNLEHYKDPKKTLKEWLRVLKKTGNLGIVVPNGENTNTDEETHYYYFTLNKLKKMLIDTKRLKIMRIGECLPGWSFYCIAKKI